MTDIIDTEELAVDPTVEEETQPTQPGEGGAVAGTKQDPTAMRDKPKRKRRTKAELEAEKATHTLESLDLDRAIEQAKFGATLEQVAALNCETPEDEIGYRAANFSDPNGKQLAYIDARYVMDVLDREVGPTNWSSSYTTNADGSVECTITVQLKSYGSVSKTDVGVPSKIEPAKGAYSDAFKRAAVHFGIARDLYDERMAEAPAPAPVAAAPAAAPVTQQTIAQATAGGEAPTGEVAAAPANPPESVVESWVCPIHGAGRIQPAGVSKRTGKAYSAFWVCDTPGCRQTGGNA